MRNSRPKKNRFISITLIAVMLLASFAAFAGLMVSTDTASAAPVEHLKMDTSKVYMGTGLSYSAANAAMNVNDVFTNHIHANYEKQSTTYYIYRNLHFYDLTSYSGGTVLSAECSFYVSGVKADWSDSLNIYAAVNPSLVQPPAVQSYGPKSNIGTLLGSIQLSSIVNAATNTIQFNADGLNYLTQNLGTIVPIYVALGSEIAGYEPTAGLKNYVLSTGTDPPARIIINEYAPQLPYRDRYTYVWDGEGADNLASNRYNWRIIIDGVTYNDYALATGSNVVFDATSIKACTWDLAYPAFVAYSFTIATGYAGTVTQGDVDIGIWAGGYLQQAGTLVGKSTRSMVCAGLFTQTGGSISGSVLRLTMTGVGNTVTCVDGTILHTITALGDTTCAFDGWARSLSVATGQELSFSKTFRLGINDASYTYSNLGTIKGTGLLLVYLYDLDYTIDFGVVDCQVQVTKRVGGNLDSALTLGSDALLGSSLRVISENTDNTITLVTAGHSLTAAGIIIGTRGILDATDSTVINHGSLDASAGALVMDGSQYVQAGDGSIKLGAGQEFYDLTVEEGVTATLLSDVHVAHFSVVRGMINENRFALTISHIINSYPPLEVLKFAPYKYQIGLHTEYVTVYVLDKPSWLAWNPYTNTFSGQAIYTGNYTVSIKAVFGSTVEYQNWTIAVTAPPAPPQWSDKDITTDFQSVMIYIIVGAALGFVLLTLSFMGRRR